LRSGGDEDVVKVRDAGHGVGQRARGAAVVAEDLEILHPGQVVLDAIIHRDGTIGDVTILRSTNEAFAQAAITAVKQWKYTPLPYEGIVTVTVNFTLPR